MTAGGATDTAGAPALAAGTAGLVTAGLLTAGLGTTGPDTAGALATGRGVRAGGAGVAATLGTGTAGFGAAGATTGRLTAAGGAITVFSATAGAAGAAATGRTATGAAAGASAASFRCVIAFSTSPGREMLDRSILVLISSSPRTERALDLPEDEDPSEERIYTRTFSASFSSRELECVFFSVTPTSGSVSNIALLFTSSSRARSLIRTLLIRPFGTPRFS